MNTVKANPILAVASAIGNCDFRVTISRYVNGLVRPWVITVGESGWQRHLVVEKIDEDGNDATFAILSPDQSDKFGYDINTKDAVARIMLSDLIRKGYTGVKKFLQPKMQTT